MAYTMKTDVALPRDPQSSTHAATKNYVDTQDASKLNIGGGTLTGPLTVDDGGSSAGLNLPHEASTPGSLLNGDLWTESDDLYVRINGTTYGIIATATGGGVPEARTLTAGNGLTGGGDLTVDRTFDVVGGTGITANANDVAINRTTVDTWYEAAGSIATHAGAADPHTGYQLESEKGSNSGYAPLDANGLVPTTHIPPLAINEVFTPADLAARLALTAQRGDMAIQTDNSKTYVLSTDDPSLDVNWLEITAAGSVVSVNGQSGVVSLDAADVSAVPTTRTVTAGAGLTDGGALSADITLNVGAGTGITVNADNIAVDTTGIDDTLAGSGLVANAGALDLNLAANGGLEIATDALQINLDGGTLSLGAGGISVLSAPKLTTARTIELTGAVTGSQSFDGSGNIQIATTAGSTTARRYSAPLTGGATSEVVTHSLNTQDVIVQVIDDQSPYSAFGLEWEATSVNTITLYSTANIEAGWRVVVIG